MPQQGCEAELGALGLCGFPIAGLGQPEGFKAQQKIQSTETQIIQSTETQTQSSETQTQSTATRSAWQHCPPASERSLPSALLCSTPHTDGERCPSSFPQLRKVRGLLCASSSLFRLTCAGSKHTAPQGKEHDKSSNL